METNNMWMIWKRETYCKLQYGQIVNVVNVYPSTGKVEVVADGDDKVETIPMQWLYNSDMGYGNGTCYEDSVQ